MPQKCFTSCYSAALFIPRPPEASLLQTELLSASDWAALCFRLSCSLLQTELLSASDWAALYFTLSFSLLQTELLSASDWAALCFRLSCSLLQAELLCSRLSCSLLQTELLRSQRQTLQGNVLSLCCTGMPNWLQQAYFMPAPYVNSPSMLSNN